MPVLYECCIFMGILDNMTYQLFVPVMLSVSLRIKCWVYAVELLVCAVHMKWY